MHDPNKNHQEVTTAPATRKLQLNRETLRVLEDDELDAVVGGLPIPSDSGCTGHCCEPEFCA